MRTYLAITFVFTLIEISFSQKMDIQEVCSHDTILIDGFTGRRVKEGQTSSINTFRAVKCESQSPSGFRIEIGYSRYYYGDKTKEWLGNHGGPNFNFIYVFGKVNFGLRFKPWTLSPQKELLFNNVILTKEALLNPIKVDYFFGYSFDLNMNFSIEPYLGWNRSSFHVINEDELQQNYSINKTGGFITGITFNKYIPLKNSGYLSIFVATGYGFVDYSKVHTSLDKGYFEWTFGIALKGFFRKRYIKVIDRDTKANTV